MALARPKPKIPFLGLLSLLRNLTETLATQARILSTDLNVQQLFTALIKNLQYHRGMLKFRSSLHADFRNHSLSMKR